LSITYFRVEEKAAYKDLGHIHEERRNKMEAV
jgi:hypothetical protein